MSNKIEYTQLGINGLSPVLSWWCLAVLDYACIILVCALLNNSPKCYFVSYSIWQKWTKWRTNVIIHGNLVLTKVTTKGITNRSTLKVHDCQIENKPQVPTLGVRHNPLLV